MEEILASIRRIITDDEAGQARGQKAAPKSQQEDESLEGEADNQIIDDIARVLSGGASQAPAEEEEEILDLAGELGGLELVEDDVVEEVIEVSELVEVVEVLELEEAETVEPLAAPEFLDEPVDEAPAPPMPEPVQQMAPPPPEMAAPQPQPPAPAPEPQAAPKPSASLEAASALERAIAALRAGQVPTSTSPQTEPFRFQTAPQPESMTAPQPAPMAEPAPEPIPMALPMEAPEPQGETHPDAESDFDAQPEQAPTVEFMTEREQRDELVLTEVELGVVETAEPEMFDAAEPDAAKAVFWPAEAEGEAEEEPAEFEHEFGFDAEAEFEPEPVAAQVNGSAHHGEGPSRTLEDSIKDMLRPMLRQWLDENMPRIVRDELDPGALRRHQD
jgi:cell pole-organizing protein PopZ